MSLRPYKRQHGYKRRLWPAPLLAAVMQLFLAAWACDAGQSEAQLLRVSDGRALSLSDIVDDLKKTRLVFVGELHDNAVHHAAQLKVIRALKEANLPVALGLEMFRRESQAPLDAWVSGALEEAGFESVYNDNWTTPWPLYRDIFVYAREAKIPLIGLNISPNVTRQVAREGFASLTPEQMGKLPPVTCRADEEYMAFIRRAFGMHGHSGKTFVYFCEAQIVWDAAMATNLVAFLEKNPSHTVVVLAGTGHAWKRGIPAQVLRHTSVPYRVILPEVSGRLDPGAITVDDADYLWLQP